MRNPKRIKRILEKIERLWNRAPDQRLGQLLENYIFIRGQRGDKTSVRLFFQEDDDTEESIDGLLSSLENDNKR